MYEIIRTDTFEKKFNKIIPKSLKEFAKNTIGKLRNNPYLGKPLSFKFIRELKIKKFRIYYMVYEKITIVLLITASDKKLQKKTISLIKEKRKMFKQYVENYLKEENNHVTHEKE